jgi:phosphoribosyl 1,2-cyclic phosphodiesterase
MKFKVIMTGSSGNCSLISYKDTNVLIDAGFSTKKKMDEIIEKHLNGFKIDAILITHEHTDHFNPWTGRFAMEYDIPIYLSKRHYENEEARKTKYLSHLDKRKNEYKEARVIDIEQDTTIYIKDLEIKIINVYHDAKKTLGFIFNNNFGYITDCGYISSKIKKELLKVSSLALEMNYDSQLLMDSERNWQNKLRVIGNFGHLDNKEAVKFIKFLKTYGKLKQVFTLHPSEHHNSKEILEKELEYVSKELEVNIMNRENNNEYEVLVA